MPRQPKLNPKRPLPRLNALPKLKRGKNSTITNGGTNNPEDNSDVPRPTCNELGGEWSIRPACENNSYNNSIPENYEISEVTIPKLKLFFKATKPVKIKKSDYKTFLARRNPPKKWRVSIAMEPKKALEIPSPPRELPKIELPPRPSDKIVQLASEFAAAKQARIKANNLIKNGELSIAKEKTSGFKRPLSFQRQNNIPLLMGQDFEIERVDLKSEIISDSKSAKRKLTVKTSNEEIERCYELEKLQAAIFVTRLDLNNTFIKDFFIKFGVITRICRISQHEAVVFFHSENSASQAQKETDQTWHGGMRIKVRMAIDEDLALMKVGTVRGRGGQGSPRRPRLPVAQWMEVATNQSKDIHHKDPRQLVSYQEQDIFS